MFKKKKKVDTLKEEILIQKENKRKIISHLTENFLLNPKAKYIKEDVLLKLKIKDSLYTEEYFEYLKNKKYIKFNKNVFYITFDGYEYLEKEEDKIKSYGNNLVSINISMMALLISTIVLFIKNRFIKAIFILAFFFKMDRFSKDILNKKYY